MLRWVFVCILAIALLAVSAIAKKRRSPKEWARFNDHKVDHIGKEWENGDDEELLVDEKKLLGDQYKRRQNEMEHVDPTAAEKARLRLSTGIDDEENALHEKALTGPTLMFADIRPPAAGSSMADASDPSKWHP